MDTRRRSACDLVKALIKQFEGPVIQNFSQYVQAMLVEYGKDPRANWKCKDTAIYLVTTLAARAQTQKVFMLSSLTCIHFVYCIKFKKIHRKI